MTEEQQIQEEQLITVCDKCFMASCWQGIFVCEDYYWAGTTQKTIKELKQLDLESPDYWKNEL